MDRIPLIGTPAHDFVSVEAFSAVVGGDIEATRFYERLGRGWLCGVFSLGGLEPLQTDHLEDKSWLEEDATNKGDPLTIISDTSNGVDIGFSRSRGFCLLDFNEQARVACDGFADALAKAAALIGRPQLLDFPFHETVSVFGESYLGHVGDQFVQRFQEAKPGILSSYQVNQEDCYLGTFSTLMSPNRHYAARLLAGPSLSNADEALLTCWYTRDGGEADRDELMKLLSNITHGEFKILRPH